ncbi:hypothetical protein BJ741DRAFT_591450 [Chytriomyces cf. hyalinus JEL632]|nr:hypothetical protein BJ741DRAFT_591450 [Chytriomyces cf. hyalinus JEL632]
MPAPTALVAMLLAVLLACSAVTARIMPIMKQPPPYEMYILSQQWQPRICPIKDGFKISSFVPANSDESFPEGTCKGTDLTMEDITMAGGDSVLLQWAGCGEGPQNYVIKSIWRKAGSCSALTPTEWILGSLAATRALPVPDIVASDGAVSVDAQQLRDVYGPGMAVLDCVGGAFSHVRTCHDFRFAPIACPAALLAADSCSGMIRI